MPRTKRLSPAAFFTSAMGLGLLLGQAAHAELPPWVYEEQQRQAPVVVRLVVLSASQMAGDWLVRGRLLKVLRQPSHGQLKPSQQIKLRYALPEMRSPGMVGPAPLPVLRPGQEVTAWIRPVTGQKGTFAPAAGGRSFGPAMGGIEP